MELDNIAPAHIANQHVINPAAFLVCNLGHQLPTVRERCQERSQGKLVLVSSSNLAAVKIFGHEQMEGGDHLVLKFGIFPALRGE